MVPISGPGSLSELSVRTQPSDSVPFGGAKKNVVMIYAESFERMFLDEERFPGVAPNLARLAKQALEFRGIRQMPYSGWTIAGQIGTQCGIPIGNGKVAHRREGLTCLGELFGHQGYRKSYLNGSRLEFAGKGDLWRSMGYDRLVGYDDVRKLAKMPMAPLSSWGAYDDTLLVAARNELKDLQSDESTPYAMTLLTVDTHSPRGIPSPSCHDLFPEGGAARRGEDPMLSALRCSDRLLGRWIEDLLASKDGNLVVVLVSDHLMPQAEPIVRSVPQDERDYLFLVWHPDIQPTLVQREGTVFDIYPTLASLLGWDLPRAGLGRSLLADEPTLLEDVGKEELKKRILKTYISEIVHEQRDGSPLSGK